MRWATYLPTPVDGRPGDTAADAAAHRVGLVDGATVRAVPGISRLIDLLGDDGERLAAAADLSPEVVLLDVQLPDIDGFEVARRLLAGDPGLPVVLVSSRDRSQYGRLIEASGARGFVAKAELSGAALAGLLA